MRLDISGSCGASNLEWLSACLSRADYCIGDAPASIELDLSDLQFVQPAGLALLSAWLTKCRLAYHSVTLLARPQHMVSSPYDVDSYLAAVGFYDMLDKDARECYTCRGDRSYFLARLASQEDCDEVATQAIACIRRHLRLEQWAKNALHISISETLDNVFQHAQSSTCTVSVQAYPRRNALQYAICDCGRGIRRSLLDNPALDVPQRDVDAIALALELGVTRNPEERTAEPFGNSGIGLFLLRELAKQNSGSLRIVSHTGCWYNRVSGATWSTPWPGTIVCGEFDLTRPLDARQIYDSWWPEDADDGEEEIPF